MAGGVPIEGIQGRGKAGVFGGSVNPLNIYLAHQANQQRLQGLRAKDEADQRDKLVDDLRKFNPDKVWEPFYDELNRHIQTNVRDKFYQLREQGLPIAAISRILDKEKSDADTLRSRMNWQKAQWEDHNDRIDQEVQAGNFIPGYYNRKLNDRYFDGKYAKLSSEIPSDHEEIYKDSKGYNVASIVNRFMDSLPDQINAHETEVWGKLGITYDIQKTKDKLGLQFDPQGKVILDPRTNKPAIAMTDEVFLMAKSNPYLKQIVDDNLGENAPLPQQREFLTQLLKGQNPVDIQNSKQLGFKYPENNGDGSGQSASIVGAGDNALKTYENIGSDKQIGFDSISFGYSSPVSIPFSNSQGGAADQTGSFSGLRTNPSTGKKEMEFVTTKPYGTPGEKEIKYVPYDEKTFQQVLNSLPKNKRDELRKLKGDFETQYANKKEYVLDESKLNSDADQITKFYDQNKDQVGSDAFNSGFSELINKLGLDKNAKSNKTFWWFNPNELTIGDQTVQAGDKEKLKQVLYNLQKGKYKKQKGQSAETNPGLIPQGKVR